MSNAARARLTTDVRVQVFTRYTVHRTRISTMMCSPVDLQGPLSMAILLISGNCKGSVLCHSMFSHPPMLLIVEGLNQLLTVKNRQMMGLE